VFVALEHAYHGDTFGAMAAGGVRVFHERFQDLLFTVRRVHPPDCPACAARVRAGLPAPDGPREELASVLAREGDRVAAVIIEPMLQGAGGMIVWPTDFLRAAREATAARGIPLIADEVLTGFGRTGKLFACEHGPIAPDLLCLSKALTGGYLPLGATLASEEVHAAFASEDPAAAFYHGHSYTGNALACAVARESLRVIDDERSLERVAALERLFAERLAELRGRPRVIDARGIGAVAAVEVQPEGRGGYLDDAGPRLQAEFLKRGILLRPLGNVLYFLPPYAITDAEAHRVFDAIADVLGK
jgi:adenosylmethionine-8-amino-7-oxononanoate aminotransferase